MADEKLTPQEEVVKKYLEEQIQNDGALRTLYIPQRIKDCFIYIKEQAKKKAVNGCAMVEDSLVFKWARDYYLEELPKKAEKEVVELAQKNVSGVSNAMDKNTAPKVSAEVHEMIDKADKILAEQKEVTVIKNGQKYDSDGNGLLFDFD